MNVHYVDSDKMQIRFHTLVIDMSALNGRLDSVLEFSDSHNIQFITNGRLLLNYSMNKDFFFLPDLVSCCVESQEFKYNNAYSFIEEQLTIGVIGGETMDFLGKELPETHDLDWLSSEINNNGCFIWKTQKSIRKTHTNIAKSTTL